MSVKFTAPQNRKKLILFGSFLLAGILLVTGIVLLSVSKSCDEPSASKNKKSSVHSERLFEFLKDFQHTYYYDLFPNKLSAMPNVRDVRQSFEMYDASPAAIKLRTDQAQALRQKLDRLAVDKSKLKLREKKAHAQLEFFLENSYSEPLTEDYYAGHWMFGPNLFCTQEMCKTDGYLKKFIGRRTIKTAKEIEELLNVIKQHKGLIEQFESNMKLGVQAGMVPAKDSCDYGRMAFRRMYLKVINDGPKGILNEIAVQKALVAEKFNLGAEEMTKFKRAYKSDDVIQYLQNAVVEYYGKPIKQLLGYLDDVYCKHAVPATVASGMANLPLEHVWWDGKKTKNKTTKTLPTGEKLDGKVSYERIMPYYTTTKQFTPQQVLEMGVKNRDKLYARALTIARKMTKKDNDDEAKELFRTDVNSEEQFFNTTAIPDNENGELGGERCNTMEAASKNCPVRFAAMTAWIKQVNRLLSEIAPLTTPFFHWTGPRATTPVCPVKMTPRFNPASGSQGYIGSDQQCSHPGRYLLPFFLKRPGPKYNMFSVAVHEGRPGHHTQVQGFREHFLSQTSFDVVDWINGKVLTTAFTEGWALYTENPLMSQGTDYYATHPYQEYGMIKWQIWRALRLIIDTGLHHRGMTQQQSLDLFREFAWDTSDKSHKDVIRYMSYPGQATAYMVGQLAIWQMRNRTETRLREAGKTFDIKDFHFQILSQGTHAPLSYIETHMRDYTECVVDIKYRNDCREILEPWTQHEVKENAIGDKKEWNNFFEEMISESQHYE